MKTQLFNKNAWLAALSLAAYSDVASAFSNPPSYRTTGTSFISRKSEIAAQTPFPGFNPGAQNANMDANVNPPFIENNGMQSEQESEGIIPTTFREAEILGLRLMQDGRYEEALTTFTKGMKLPGSRMDIVRTKNVSGPSPVGGAAGGTEGKEVWSLDEFEYQAAYYNMACACAKLGAVPEAVDNLRSAYEKGFENIKTMTSDPDLRPVFGSVEFEMFMDDINPKKKGLFGLF